MRCSRHPEKRRFKSANQALVSATRAARDLGSISIYKCRACHGYHLSKVFGSDSVVHLRWTRDRTLST